MKYKIQIESEVRQDIQEGIDWYNEQQRGLGRKFHAAIKEAFRGLRTNPFFQIRYDDVRCVPLRKYPYMIHFTIDENNKTIAVIAVFNTSRNPQMWKGRSKN